MGEQWTIIVLCDTYKEAQWAYDVFKRCIEYEEDLTIVQENEYSLDMMSNEMIRYIFIDKDYIDYFKPDSFVEYFELQDFLFDVGYDILYLPDGGKLLHYSEEHYEGVTIC